MELEKGIDLDQHRTQAKELVKLARSADPAALARIREHHPEGERAFATKFALADAHLVLAREFGFESWPRLKGHLEFLRARQAMDEGDLETLRNLIEANPRVLEYRCSRGEPYEQGYFKDATLLWHIAGNPDRAPIPPNIVEITRLLLSRGVKPEHAKYTAGLILTSRQASEAKVALPLLDLLVGTGAGIDLDQSGALIGPIFNVAPETAEALVARGTPLDFRTAAGLGRLDFLESHPEVDQVTLDEALLFAVYGRRMAAVRWLVERGAKGDILTPHSHATALHSAVSNDDPEMVRLLVEHGSRIDIPDKVFHGTAVGWAKHGGQDHLVEILLQSTSRSDV
jgi:peptide-methionine (S)-S-oxide reductase